MKFTIHQATGTNDAESKNAHQGKEDRIQKTPCEEAGEVEAKAAEAAKDGCPVSNALKGNMQFVLDAKLET